MTNIAFCPPGAEVCLFSPASAREFFFWFLSNLKHLVYSEIRCHEVGPVLGPLPWDRKVAFPLAEMENVISRLWTNQSLREK